VFVFLLFCIVYLLFLFIFYHLIANQVSHIFSIIVCLILAFSALTLLVGHREEHPARKIE